MTSSLAPLGFALLLALLVLAIGVLARGFAARREALWRWADERLRRIADAAAVRGWLAAHPAVQAFVVRRLSPSGYLGLHLTLGLLASIGALTLFGTIAEDVVNREELARFDVRLASYLHAHATRTGIAIFKAVTQFGSVAAMAALALVVVVLLLVRRRWLLAVGWTAAFAGGGLLNLALKQFFHRPRPTAQFVHEITWSFPSGHSMGSLIGYGMLAYLLLLALSDRRAQVATVLLALALVLAIGISRLYLGVHYFTDVVGGYAAGTVWLSACISGVEVVRRRLSK